MLLFINSLSHLLVDALCAATIFGPVSAAIDLTAPVLLYNTLAFSTQCLVGLAADRLGRHAYAAAFSMLLIILGFVLPLPAMVRICFVGVGNSVFHVAGGAMTLLESRGKAGKLGVFVAPGCIGLTLGTLYPQFGYLFAVLMVLCAVFVVVVGAHAPSADMHAPALESGCFDIAIPILLTCAVAVRAVGGSAASFSWKTTGSLTLLMTLFVFAGKTAGGFVCDRLGAKASSLISIPIAALLIAFCSNFMLPSLIGQFALNLTMPITLWLLYRAMPDAPAFAFGLAASALWPGTIAGQLMRLTGPALWLCIIVSFVFGLWAIQFSAKRIFKQEYMKQEGSR